MTNTTFIIINPLNGDSLQWKCYPDDFVEKHIQLLTVRPIYQASGK